MHLLFGFGEDFFDIILRLMRYFIRDLYRYASADDNSNGYTKLCLCGNEKMRPRNSCGTHIQPK